MAIVFLSHSSYDNEVAAEIRRGLVASGYESVFLDVDEVAGIRPGSGWRRELSRHLRTADAVVFLGSSHSERSVWCTAELAVAKTLEKVILPVQVERDAHHELLDEDQWVVYRSSVEESLTRLVNELERSSRAAAHQRSWDESRSPFPGLRPFDIEDAGVFFGRDAAIDELVRMTDPAPLLDHRSVVAIVGASGTGKSSLVRAGLIPELSATRRTESRWLIIPPFQPGRQPLIELGRALVRAGAEAGAAEAVVSGDRSLVDVVDELARGESPPAEKVLVVLDQAEELCDKADRVPLLEALLETAERGAGGRVVMTVREGYVGRLFAGVEIDGRVVSLPLGPMSRVSLASAIEGPAARADLSMEPGFVQHVLDDAGSGEALPLLALALDRTYRSMMREGTRRFTRDRYQAAGGVAHALAQQAAEAVAAVGAAGEVRTVRLLMDFVTVDEEGHWTRRRKDVTTLVEDERQVVHALEAARLVVVEEEAGQLVATVAHSALFWAWPPLARALEAEADDLRFRRRLERDGAAWNSAGRPTADLPVGQRYKEIAGWLGGRADHNLDEAATAYVGAARRLDTQRHRRRLLLAAGVGLLALTAAVLGLGQLQARARAGEAARLADARGLLGRALDEPRVDLAVDLGLQALAKERSPEVVAGLLGIVAREPLFRGYVGPPMPAAGRALCWAPSGGLVVGDAAGQVTTWSARGVVLSTSNAHHGRLVRSVAEAPGGDWTAVADVDGHIYVQRHERTEELTARGQPAHRGTVADLIVIDGRRLSSASADGTVAVWDVTRPTRLWARSIGVPVWSVARLASSGVLAVGTADGRVITFDEDTGAFRGSVKPSTTTIRSLAASGRSFVAGDDSGAIFLVDADADGAPRYRGEPPIYHGSGPVWTLAAADDGEILTGWTDGAVRLIDGAGGLLNTFDGHDGPIRDVAFDPNTNWFAATGDDGLVSRWDLTGDSLLVHQRLSSPSDLVGDIDQRGRVYVAGTDQRVSVVEPGSDLPRGVSAPLGDAVVDIDASDDGSLVAVGLLHGRALALSVETGRPVAELHVGDGPAHVALAGHVLVAGDTQLRTVDVRSAEQQELALPTGVEITTLAAGDEGWLIVAGGKGGERGAVLLSWTGRRPNLDAAFFGTRGLAVNAVDLDPSHHRAVVGRSDGRIEVWRLDPLGPTGVAFTRHKREIYDVRFASDGTTVLSLDGAGLMWTWNPDYGTSLAQPVGTELRRARRLLPDRAGTLVSVVGQGGITVARLDLAGIEELACELTARSCD